MLAGYLPFDDDPANPEGDNINLLYKYIVSTPLTFPEYVTPHARDLLRRILVPNPRNRADLFEVARHSWLSDYAHVVSHVTSSTTTVGEIANTTVTAGKLHIHPGSSHAKASWALPIYPLVTWYVIADWKQINTMRHCSLEAHRYENRQRQIRPICLLWVG